MTSGIHGGGGLGDSIGANTDFLNPIRDTSTGTGEDTQFTSGFDISPFNPPDMKTLVYAPEVRILVAHGHKQYDVSKDLVRGTIIRKENSASTLFFTVANKEGRYNGLFARMDRVTVFMKRIRWQQVFSGYLDTVPFRQLYGGMGEFKATCTLKRLLHTWWNPALPESIKVLDQFTAAGSVAGDAQASVDSGLGALLGELLQRVGGWNKDNIHIQNFPMTFFAFMQQQIDNSAANQAQVDKFKQLLLGPNINAVAPMQYAGTSAAAGPPGPPSAGEASHILQIIAACDEKGLGPQAEDLSQSAQLTQTGLEAQQSRDEATKKAGETIEESGRNMYIDSTKNDAAILGVACAMVESGGGVTIRNLANPAVPDSMAFPNEGTGTDHDSVGIFQQRNNGAWGTTAQRMNPRQAAAMFFDRLAGFDWRNMDPGQAIQRVQGSNFPARYAPAIQLATQKVVAVRQSQQGVGSAIAASPLGPAVSSVAGAAGLNGVLGAATSTPGTPGEAAAKLAGKPNPDSEGAVMEAYSHIGAPYTWGGNGPSTFDCSGFMVWNYRAIGKDLSSIRNTQTMANSLPAVPPSNIQRGDLVISPARDHVVMWLGDGTQIDCTTDSIANGVAVRPFRYDLSKCHIVHIADNGGINPAAPRLNPAMAGPGMPVGTGDQSASGTGVSGSSEPIALNLFAYQFLPGQFASPVASLFSVDHKEYIDAQPLIQMVQAVCRAGLRNFASAPNGDFIAYYPDHFGIDQKPAVVRLEDIELKDVKINLSDDNLTTHVYVNGDISMVGANIDPVVGWLSTAGSVTVEHDWLFRRLTAVTPGDWEKLTGQEMMRRFGVRPFKQTFSMAGSHALEFLLACQIFMEKWAQQFQTSVSFTFMPELFPGMRVLLSDHKLQVYVNEVTHSFDWENGFVTSAVISAPSVPGATQRMSQVTGGTIRSDETGIMQGLGFDSAGTSGGA